jgi:hypothetical protein
MNANTLHNHIARLSRRLDDIYSTAHFYCPTHHELIAQVTKEIRQDSAWSRLPIWARSALSERDRVHFEYIQREMTVFLFPQPSGHPLAWDEMPDEVRRTYCATDKRGKAYWLRRKRNLPSHAHTGGQKTGPQEISRVYEITTREW